jgi:transcriptional regulator with GAF, ATPase, and Fis domain
MVRVNRAAIPAALLESELFGREKGAYTGALSKQIGRFELANGSTIFLDEIGELSHEVQVKLLRVLQEREIERLGSPKPILVDVRVIAATNHDLEKDVREGRFRQDLFYRLNVFPISLPPLRERKDDIPLLAWNFVDEFSASFGKAIGNIPGKVMDALTNYSWPGNVRELRNIIERGMIVSDGPELRLDASGFTDAISHGEASLQEMERRYILKVLEITAWRIRGENGAAGILQMKPTTLEGRMRKLGIKRQEK